MTKKLIIQILFITLLLTSTIKAKCGKNCASCINGICNECSGFFKPSGDENGCIPLPQKEIMEGCKLYTSIVGRPRCLECTQGFVYANKEAKCFKEIEYPGKNVKNCVSYSSARINGLCVACDNKFPNYGHVIKCEEFSRSLQKQVYENCKIGGFTGCAKCNSGSLYWRLNSFDSWHA